MRHWKRRLKAPLLVATVLFAGLSMRGEALANQISCPSNFNPCSLDGCFEVGGELLIWHPCGRDMVLGNVVSQQTTSDVYLVKPRWNAGFRVWAGYSGCEGINSIQLRYTYFHDRTIRNVSRPVVDLKVPGMRGTYNRLEGKRTIGYWNIDLRGVRSFSQGCDSSFYGFGGIRYVDLEDQFRIIARFGTGLEDQVTSAVDKATFKGVGIQGGLGFDYSLCAGFGLGAEASAQLAVGDKRNKWRAASPTASTFFNVGGTVPSCLGCVPGFDIRVNLNYTCCPRGMILEAELGYEIEYYFSAVRHPIARPSGGANIRSGPTLLAQYNLSFQGPYVSLKVRF